MAKRRTAAKKTATSSDPAPTTKESLIAAAVEEFSRKGLAGARVDEIAAAANVNKQLVYHYFGSKEGLYLGALESVYARIRQKEQTLHLIELEPVEAMRELVGFSFDYLNEHPEFIALLTDENRRQGSHIRNSIRLRSIHSPFIVMLTTTLRRGIKLGLFRSDLDPVNLYISIAGLSYFFFSNNHTLSAIFGKRLSSRAARTQRRQHVIKFALEALRPDDDASPR